MIDTRPFGEELKKLGFHFFSGVPCSFLKPLINYAMNECTYIAAANEGDAVAIAAGAFLGGQKSVVLMQNSGLTNAISPLTSLNYIFKIPVLGFVSLRGETGISDEPQHELMGKITIDMLELLNIHWAYLSDDIEIAIQQLKDANVLIEQNQSFFFVVKKGIFRKENLNIQGKKDHIQQPILSEQTKENQLPTRYQALEVINQKKDSSTILLATTGKTGRELNEIEDSKQHFYMVGSMGCISSFGLGLSLAKKDKKIIVIDGDGSLLMRMGSLATNGYYHPPNMLHILLDNNAYESTGGQKTVSDNVNFVKLTSSSGYPHAIYAHNLSELQFYIQEWERNQKLTFLYMKISAVSKENLGRPKSKPSQVKERLQVFIND